MNKEITLSDFFQFVLSKLKLILIFGIIAAIAAFGVVRLTADLKYNYHGSMLVDPLSGVDESYNSNALMSELNIAKALIPTYISVLQSNDFGEYVAKHVKSEFKITVSKKTVVDMISYSFDNERLIINYKCTSTDKKLAYAVAKVINDKAPEYITNLIEHSQMKPVNKVQKNDFTTDTTSAVTMAVIAFIAAAVLTVLISLLVDLFDNRIKTTEDITERFEYPILGTIPDFYANNKNGEGYYGDEKQQPKQEAGN